MATIYLARDVRHDRLVALKLLKPELAAVIGADRFLHEIRVTANLQHPHILPLHDSGQLNGTVFYVMPFVEGESLRTRLDREKQLPIDAATNIAIEVASALDYAHRHGVIHRDIKPENILLHDGRAVVADFGIALAVTTAGGQRMTETGLSLGTPHYMSPEQAMGEREITAKSDVYALGCVLYEMLIGEPPFTGPTAQAIVARVMTEEPRSPTLQRKTIPPYVERAVLTALAKLPADRFESAAAFAAALGPAGAAAAARGEAAGARPRSTRAAALAASLAAAALVVGLVAGRFIRVEQTAALPPARLSVTLPTGRHLSSALGRPRTRNLALSPDGATLVYIGEAPSAGGEAGGTQLFVRRLDDLTPTPIPGTVGALNPMFSPDGQSIAFLTSGQLYRLTLGGSAPVKIPAPPGLALALWTSPEEFFIAGSDGALGVLKADGTVDRRAGKPDHALLPLDVLPDGVLLFVSLTSGSGGPLLALDPRSGRREVILSSRVSGAWYTEGQLLWMQPDGALLTATFDATHHKLTGAAVTLATNILAALGGTPQVAISRSGTLVYLPSPPSDLVLVERGGRAQSITRVPSHYHNPRVSPDGRRVAVDILDQTGRDVWLLDLNDQTLRRITFDTVGHDPTWMPAGDRVLYANARGGFIGVFSRRADGNGSPDSVLVQSGITITAHTVTPDGREALAVRQGGGAWDIVSVSLTGDHSVRSVLSASFNQAWPALSPDGHWLAYSSDETGRYEVYARPYPGPGASVLISQSGGNEPVWSRDGKQLFYRAVGGTEEVLIAAALDTRPELHVTGRAELFGVAQYEDGSPHANYDVTADGRFVMVRHAARSELVLLQNWKELARRQAAFTKR